MAGSKAGTVTISNAKATHKHTVNFLTFIDL